MKLNQRTLLVPIDHLLIIRFSSFGDIVQAASAPLAFKREYPNAKVDWLVRSDFAELLSKHPYINRVCAFDRNTSAWGLVRFAWRLAGEATYTHIYDAHNNLRSTIVLLTFWARRLLAQPASSKSPHHWKVLRRPKNRIRRWLFFRLRLNLLPRPFRGAESYVSPLRKWGVESNIISGQNFWPAHVYDEINSSVRSLISNLPKPHVVLAPSAAWKMKRWPIGHWRTLIQSLNGISFILLGGPDDGFLAELKNAAPGRVLNLQNQLSLSESSALLSQADLVIANDTGLLHVADQMERPTLALIGPTAFGYPSHSTSRSLEIELKCKPCSKDGRGRCKNDLYQRCLVELSPEKVREAVIEMLAQAGFDK